jgi:hypothetical protein
MLCQCYFDCRHVSPEQEADRRYELALLRIHEKNEEIARLRQALEVIRDNSAVSSFGAWFIAQEALRGQ